MARDPFSAHIGKIEGAIGYTFRDKALLRQAFTRTSWCNEHPEGDYQSNEVLEFFGDSALSIAIVSFLLKDTAKRYAHGIRTELREGDFSNIKSRLSDKTNLSGSMQRLGLQEYLLVGEGDRKLGIKDEPSVMEDLFESIIGAVYIDTDRDMSIVSRVVASMLDMSVYTGAAAVGVSPKNALQEWCAAKKRRLPPPVYRTVSETGPDHKKSYERGVYIGERLVATASGKNQKTADALAARAALDILIAEEGASAETWGTNAAPRDNKSDGEGKQDGANPAAADIKPTPKKPKAQDKPDPKGGADIKPTPKKPKAQDKPDPKGGAEMKRQNPQKTPEAPKASAGRGESPTAALKKIAAAKGGATPSFRDLGLIAEDEHSVECSFMGRRSIATAPTRSEAKECAARTILEAIRRDGIK